MSEEKSSHTQGSFSGWAVEARAQGEQPAQIGDQIFDNRWRRVSFQKVAPPLGVPNPSYHSGELAHCGLYGYHAAQALRYWFHAHMDNSLHCFSIQTRLASYNVTHRIEWTRAGEQEEVGAWPEKSTANPEVSGK
jgi:hypothetical protein